MVGSILYMAAVSLMQGRLRGPGQLLELADPTGGPDCSNRQWLPVLDIGLSQIQADGDLIVLLGRAMGLHWQPLPSESPDRQLEAVPGSRSHSPRQQPQSAHAGKVCQRTEYCQLPYGKSSAAVPLR
jgi:hypothetical protein